VLALKKSDTLVAVLKAEAFDDATACLLRLRGKREPLA
jgi:hypothetical protein